MPQLDQRGAKLRRQLNLLQGVDVAKGRQTVSLQAMAHRDWNSWSPSLEPGSYDAGHAMEEEHASGCPQMLALDYPKSHFAEADVALSSGDLSLQSLTISLMSVSDLHVSMSFSRLQILDFRILQLQVWTRR